MWKTVLTIAGVIILVIFVVFLYLVIAGAEESRKNDK